MKGLKIKELARELGVTSRVLIDRCRAEGLDVQNSVTRLAPDDVRRVRGWYQPTADVATDAAETIPLTE